MNRNEIKNRKVIIENFRNIITPSKEQHLENLKNNKQDGNELILNHDNKEGGVVLLIGPNNSGKSNILDALEYYRGNIKERKPGAHLKYDVTNYYLYKWYETKNVHPNWFRTDKEKEENVTNIEISSFNSDLYSIQEISKSEIFDDSFWNKIVTSKCYDKSWNHNKEEIIHILSDEGKIGRLLATIIWIFSNLKYGIDGSLIELPSKDIVQLARKNFNSLRWFIKTDDWLCKIMRDDTIVNVIRYDERFEEILDKDLDINLLGHKSFVDKFFSAIDNGLELRNQYIEVYKNRRQSNSAKFPIYEDIINKINKSLINVSNKFNELYSLSNEKYVFELRRKESYNIYRLSLSIEEKDNETIMINLEEQSWGFKWFFNFFFNVFSNITPYPGDIVLLEEPAVNIHIEGQIKWMKFVREFAHKNKLTFVITTHSPFLLDPDHLDEIRIVYKEGKYCKINNYFSINSDDDIEHGGLENIKRSMTFQNIASILYKDKNSQFYLVNEVIDYAIFTYFKKINSKYENLHFIPINGLNIEASSIALIEKIIETYGSNIKVLVNADDPGLAFEELNKKLKTGLDIIKFSDIIENKINIKSLFANNDLEMITNKWNDITIMTSKSLSLLSFMKNPVNYFSQETVRNFKIFFEVLFNE
ncbi:MAG: AAA family ATPase [Metamycoplasmataceae bacterium]